MFQQWRKPHTLVISPEGVSVKMAKQVKFLSQRSESKLSNVPWSQVLNDFELQASELRSQAVKVIISNHYVRYAVLPWQANIHLKKDWLSIAENHLRKLYGNVVDTWQINIALQGYGCPIIISAIDNALLEQIKRIAKNHNWSLQSVEPAFLSLVDYFTKQLKKQSCLAMIEANLTVLAQIDKDVLVQFSVISPVEEDQKQEIDNLLSRTHKLQAANKNPIVYVVTEDYMPQSSINNISVVNLLKNKSSDEKTSMPMMLAELL